jgi:hypothetical protein
MYPLNDKDLDRLSRDAAEHYDVESSASGWERLESRLDKELPVKEKSRRRFLFWLVLIGLLSGGSLVYMLGSAPEQKDLQAANAPEFGKTGNSPAAAPDADGNAGSIAESKKGSAVTLPDGNTVTENQHADQTSANKTPNENSLITPTEKSNQVAGNKTNPTNISLADKPKTVVKKAPAAPKADARSQRTAARNPRGNNAVIADNETAVRDKKFLAEKQQAEQDVVKNEVPVTDAQKTNDVAVANNQKADAEKTAEPAQKTDTAVSAPAVETVAKKPETKKQTPALSRWEFGIVTGPDFNNVEFKESAKAGLNIGAYVGFRISNRLLVNTGLIYTKKWYNVDGDDFYPPKHSYISYQDVDKVAGSCNMFEIPLNIRYDITTNKKGRFFASTGASAYIMDKQDYDCSYWTGTGSLAKYYWKTDSNYNYIFSNLNLSIGYERTLGKHFSIQAEPYLKLPLKGLGYGSVRMNSYGMFVTFKYKPSARSHK